MHDQETAPEPFSKVKKKSVTIASQMYPLI